MIARSCIVQPFGEESLNKGIDRAVNGVFNVLATSLMMALDMPSLPCLGRKATLGGDNEVSRKIC